MNKTFFTLISIILIISCKPKSEESTTAPLLEENQQLENEKELARYQKVAHQAGLKFWDEVKTIEFSFNVSKNGTTQPPRVWKWNPKTDDVVLQSKGEVVSYNRNNVLDSLAISTDRAFVNDIYWLLPAFKLVWDEGTRITYPQDDLIRLEYLGNGGYTPGDRYDLTVNNEEQITSWSYFPKGANEAAITTSFENYKSFAGIEIAQDHKTPDGSLNIFFTNIKVTK